MGELRASVPPRWLQMISANSGIWHQPQAPENAGDTITSDLSKVSPTHFDKTFQGFPDLDGLGTATEFRQTLLGQDGKAFDISDAGGHVPLASAFSG